MIFFCLTLINNIYEVPSQDLPVKEVKAWKVSLPVGILHGKQSRGKWKILGYIYHFFVVRQHVASLKHFICTHR